LLNRRVEPARTEKRNSDIWRRTGLEPNANVAVGMDSERFVDLLLQRLARLG